MAKKFGSKYVGKRDEYRDEMQAARDKLADAYERSTGDYMAEDAKMDQVQNARYQRLMDEQRAAELEGKKNWGDDALAGASMGSAFGPWGALIGGLAGTAKGMFEGIDARSQSGQDIGDAILNTVNPIGGGFGGEKVSPHGIPNLTSSPGNVAMAGQMGSSAKDWMRNMNSSELGGGGGGMPGGGGGLGEFPGGGSGMSSDYEQSLEDIASTSKTKAGDYSMGGNTGTLHDFKYRKY
jgi:hypothetical protein